MDVIESIVRLCKGIQSSAIMAMHLDSSAELAFPESPHRALPKTVQKNF